MRRRSFALLAALVLAAAACGSSTDDAGTETPVSTTAAPATAAPTPTEATPTTAAPTTTAVPTSVAPSPPFEVEVTEAVYATGTVRDGEIDLIASVYVPVDAPGPRPVYVHFPGGGFQSADPANAGPARALAEQGYVAASIGYRVQGDDPIPSTRVGGIYDAVGGDDGPGLARAIAAAVEDGVTGLEWLLARSDELDLDLDRVVVGGGSAGAITANHIAYTADDFGFERPPVAATVDLWGGFTLARPADAVTGDEPPVFIVHGTDDGVVPYSFTEDFVAAAAAVGLPYELHPVVGAGHGVDLATTPADDGEPILDHLIAWLDATLAEAA